MRLIRRGFTLAELLVVTVVGGMAASLGIATLVRHQRFYENAAEILDVRSQLRDGADILAADLRSAAVAALGVPLMVDSAVEIYAVVASSIACTVQSATTVGLPPLRLASGNSLTSVLAMPDTGDLALVYVQASPDSGSWKTAGIAAFQSRSLNSTCPPSARFTTAADTQSGYLVTLAGQGVDSIRPGTPIHFVRRGRYSLYRSSDNRWYLGYRRCGIAGGGCAGIQPVSGPYDPYSPSGAGISFRYYDAEGTPIHGQSGAVARIDFVLRRRTSSAFLTAGRASPYRDSILTSVSPRNRAR